MSADTNEDNKGALAGAQSISGTSPLSQNMWKTRSPTLYVARVLSAQPCRMMAFTLSWSSNAAGKPRVVRVSGWGSHFSNRSLAAQCGRRSEDDGVRFSGYGNTALMRCEACVTTSLEVFSSCMCGSQALVLCSSGRWAKLMLDAECVALRVVIVEDESVKVFQDWDWWEK